MRLPLQRLFSLRLRFGLRAVFYLVFVAAAVSFACRLYLASFWEQARTVVLIRELGGTCECRTGGPPWLRKVFCESEFQEITRVDLADCDSPSDYVESISCLPELDTLLVGSTAFSDDHFASVTRIPTLRLIVLDSTLVTDEAVEQSRATRPGLAIRVSQRRAIADLRRREVEVTTTISRDACEGVADEHWQDASVAMIRHATRDSDLVSLPQLRTLKEFRNSGSATISNGALQYLIRLRELNTILLWRAENITDAGLAQLSRLPALAELDLQSTGICGTGFQAFLGNSVIRRLDVSQTRFDDIGMAYVSTFGNLEFFGCSETRVSDKGLSSVAQLKNLHGLGLGKAQITDNGMQFVAGLRRLETLYLAGTPISDKGIEHLKVMTNLQELHLGGTNLSDAGLAHFVVDPENWTTRYVNA